MNKKRVSPLWIVLVAGPLVASVVFFLSLGGENYLIPLHWGFDGQVSSYGPPWTVIGLGVLMSAVNLMICVFHRDTDRFHDMGVIHGVSKANAPKVLLGCAVMILAIHLIILFFAAMGVAVPRY